MLYVSHLSKVIFCCAVYLHSVKRFSLSMLLHDHINVINRRYGEEGGGVGLSEYLSTYMLLGIKSLRNFQI